MGRTAKFSEAEMLDAALEVLDRSGIRSASVGRIAGQIGAPTGSIYHRFESRDLLLARLWLRTVEQFQEGFCATLTPPDTIEAAMDAARFTPAWVRSHPREARLLLLHRREDLLDGAWPAEMSDRSEQLGQNLASALRGFTTRHFGSYTKETLARTTMALVDLPYGAVRRYIGVGKVVPGWIDDSIAGATRAILTAP